MSTSRYFENCYPDYTPGIGDLQEAKLTDHLRDQLQRWMEEKVEILLKNYSNHSNDYSVYTGEAGIALLFLRLADTIYQDSKRAKKLIHAAKSIGQASKKMLYGKRITFLCGDAGPLALNAVIAHREKNLQEFDTCIGTLTSMVDKCCNDTSLPDEMLYGRAGFLYALLFIRKHCGNESFPDSFLSQICGSIIESGSKTARGDRSKTPLKYQWHGKEYIGAAHGYFGILFLLLHPDLVKLDVVRSALSAIKESLDVLFGMRFPSGNFPSSVGNDSDRLVQWCHGSPGAVNTLVRAHQVYGDEKYLIAAEKCCDIVWERGLLKKGYGICHGAAGNAYAFLTMYKCTKDEKYIYRAIKFGEWCVDYGKHGCRTPDRPLSLYEGLAGTVYYVADLLNPENAGFPGFEM